MNIRYLRRYNVCRMYGRALTSGVTFRRSANVFPCFFKAFYFIDRHPNDIYRIQYTLHINKRCDGEYNNFAFLDKKGIRRLLNSFKAIIPFKYSISENNDKYFIDLNLEGTGLQHKGLLMLSRSLFEYPHNLCGYDAIKLRNRGVVEGVDFTKIPLFDLYINGIASLGYVGNECFINRSNVELISTAALRDRLKINNSRHISSVLTYNNIRRESIEPISDDSQLDDEDKFIERTKVYINNLNISFNESENLLP